MIFILDSVGRTVVCVFSNIFLVNGPPDFLGNVFELTNPNPITLE